MEVKEGGGADRVGGELCQGRWGGVDGKEEVGGSGREMHMVDAMATGVPPGFVSRWEWSVFRELPIP